MKTIFSHILVMLVSISVWQHSAYAQTVPTKGCLEADILLVVDWSGSVHDKQDYMIQAINAYSRSFVLTEDGIKLGIISFGDVTSIRSFITADTFVIDQGIVDLYKDNGNYNTRCDDVPSYASTLFAQSTEERGKTAERRFLIFISDGDVERQDSVSASFRAFAERENVTVCSILIEGNVEDKKSAEAFMADIADQNYLFYSSYQQLRKFIVTLNLCM